GGQATFYLTAGLIEERRAPWWDRVAWALERARGTQAEWTAGGETVRLTLGDGPARRHALAQVLRRLRVGPAEQAARLAPLEAALDVAGTATCELATWEQARALADAGMEIGAHTLTHPFLDRLDAAEQSREIGGSVRVIAERLGVAVVGLA